VVAELVGQAREVDRVGQRLCARGARADRGLVEDADAQVAHAVDGSGQMTDSEFPPPHSHAGRRRIATRSLADATSIGFAIVRRPASA
jgi:hypothetical protein